MNAETIAVEIKKLEDNNVSWEVGSLEEQAVALLAHAVTTSGSLADDSDVETIAKLIYAFTADVQIRDYVMGLLGTFTEERYQALSELTDLAPEGYKAPFFSLLSAIAYEDNETEVARKFVSAANMDVPEYSLAALLNRVYAAGWDPKEMAVMRNELHPKVVAGIFGEEK